MIGDSPQPGETPRTEGDPWSFADPDAAWWRGDRSAGEGGTARGRAPQAASTGTLPPPSPPERTEEAAEGHAAGSRDTAEELTAQINPPLVESPAVERDHDRPDPHRYDPLRPPAGHAAKAGPSDDKASDQAEPPDVMVLPEPDDRNRPTVALDTGAAAPAAPAAPTVEPPPAQPPVVHHTPGRHAAARPTEPLPPPTGQPSVDSRLEKLENSPFWQNNHEEALARPIPGRTGPRSHRPRKPPGRRPLSAHLTMITLGLLAAFFAWVSAEPFWLSTGHGDRGYATVTRCTGDGITQRCAGKFAEAGGRYSITEVTLLGVEDATRAEGTTIEARMVSPSSRQAYVGDPGWLIQLRWLLGFALVLVCGYGIAGATGARKLPGARARRAAILISLAGPLTLLAGFLIAAY